MKTKLLSVMSLIVVAMCACNNNSFVNEPIQESEVVMSRAGESSSVGEYTVTPEMVCKYLNLARKGKNINSLNPIVENGDTLAYVAQYDESQGWDLISGDRRISPVLAFSDEGVLNIVDSINNPAVKAVCGMLQIIRDAKSTNNIEKHSIWKALEHKVYNNTVIPRGWGQGKWIAIDTVYNYQAGGINHIIKTQWGQDYPWNIYTPLGWIKTDQENNETYGIYHCAVGCGAVALGQLIYHYRKNNNRGIALPTSAYFTDSIVGSRPIFSNFSVAGWSGLANNKNENGTASTARFLSYLGGQLNSNYGHETNITPDSLFPILNAYQLTGSELNTYDYYKVLESLKANKPVIMGASNNGLQGHAFLIDCYRNIIDEIYVNYEFDPYYEVSEDELSIEDPKLFEWPEKENPFEGVVMKREYWEYSNSIYFRMNWGYDGAGDNINYIACYKSLEDMKLEQQSGIVTDGYIYTEWAQYNRVEYCIYNIVEMP